MLTNKTANRKDIRTASNGVQMQHRHFALIAAILNNLQPKLDESEFATVVDQFWRDLAATNPRFDRDRFIAAVYRGVQ